MCIMACENVSFDVQGYFDQFLNNTTVTEHTDEVPKLCPLCNSPIRLYFINLKNEKFLMCENILCEFPFGYEDLQIVRDKKDPSEDYGVRSRTGSISTLSWTTNTIPGSIEEDTLSESSTNVINYKETNEIPNQNHNERKQKTICKTLNDIKELQQKYVALDSDEFQAREHRCLKNKKWINKLRGLEALSGKKLLKPEEIILSKKTEPYLGLGELKIDIDSGNGSGMKINVQIQNPNEEKIINKFDVKPSLEVEREPIINVIVIQDEHPNRFMQPNATNIENEQK